jgi:hypothetical protein
VKSNRATNAALRRITAVGHDQLDDSDAIEDPHASGERLLSQNLECPARRVLQAAHVDHAAAREAPDLTILIAADRNAPANVVLDPLALLLK